MSLRTSRTRNADDKLCVGDKVKVCIHWDNTDEGFEEDCEIKKTS